jgi:phage minor structural protein
MITIYEAKATDFSSNGLGVLAPLSCKVSRELNKSYQVELVHARDEAGKWRLLAYERILRVPVPEDKTPALILSGTTAHEVWKVATNGSRLRMRSGPSLSAKIIGRYPNGTKVTVVEKTNHSWYRVTGPDGRTGYMSANWLSGPIGQQETPGGEDIEIQSKQVRDQPFRIYKIAYTADTVTAYARHLFFDLADDPVLSLKLTQASGQNALKQIFSAAHVEHEFVPYTDITDTADMKISQKMVSEALLGDGGFVDTYGGEVMFDWYDVYVMKSLGEDRGMAIRRGKDLTSIKGEDSVDGMVTRVIPIGKDKSGSDLFLPGDIAVKSEQEDRYAVKRTRVLRVGDAKVDKKQNAEAVYKKMRKAAEEMLADGADAPESSLNVGFVDLTRSAYASGQGVQPKLYVGDTVTVIDDVLGLNAKQRVQAYTFDALSERYLSVTLGDEAPTTFAPTITRRQLPDQIISGEMLAPGAVGAGALQDGSVSSSKVQEGAIEEKHLGAGAVSAQAIEALRGEIRELVSNNVTTDELYAGIAAIAAAQITAANIEEANIDWANIGTLAAKIAEVSKAHLGDADIDWASIANLTATAANVAKAQIAEAEIDGAQITDASIDSAKISEAAVQTAHIEDAAITKAKIALLAVDEAQIADLAVGMAKIKDASVSTAKIQDLAVTAAKIANATITNAQIANATIGTAQIALGAITTALIQQGAVGTAQIADGSITDAKIVELSANRITAGTLSVERLIIVGSEQSIVYTINEANGTPQLSQSTIDGGSLTQRSITADRIVAGTITANELAAATILANNIAAGAVTTEKLAAEAVDASKIKAGSITTNLVASNFGDTLDLSSNTSVRSIVTKNVHEAIEDIEIGGVNLVKDSSTHTLVADGEDSYWIAADELELGKMYTLSVREVVLSEGQAAGVTWKVVNRTDGSVHASGLLDFTYGKQSVTFTLPKTEGNWALFLYAGVSGTTTGITVIFNKVKLEEGCVATSWSAAPEETSSAIGQIVGQLEGLDEGLDGRVQSIIDALGLSEQFASTDDFLAALADVEHIRSELSQTDSDLTLTFNRLVAAENGIAQMFSYFQFGEDDGAPFLDMGSSQSSVKMRLTNTRLAFVQTGQELAYFSDNKLYVTRLEAVEQISIGTESNGFLDIVTTPTGVGFKWRA